MARANASTVFCAPAPRCSMIDDVATTGGSILKAIEGHRGPRLPCPPRARGGRSRGRRGGEFGTAGHNSSRRFLSEAIFRKFYSGRERDMADEARMSFRERTASFFTSPKHSDMRVGVPGQLNGECESEHAFSANRPICAGHSDTATPLIVYVTLHVLLSTTSRSCLPWLPDTKRVFTLASMSSWLTSR